MKMPYTAEYGSKLFEDHKSIYEELDRGTYVNPHGISFPVVLYHRTAGYKIAGAAAIWTEEVWGYSIQYQDGTTGGKFSTDQFSIYGKFAELTGG